MIVVKAEALLDQGFFKLDSPELKAVRVIKELNLRIIRDQHRVLERIQGMELGKIHYQTNKELDPIVIELFGVRIYADEKARKQIFAKYQQNCLYYE